MAHLVHHLPEEEAAPPALAGGAGDPARGILLALAISALGWVLLALAVPRLW